jgi:hypothetical protein
MEPVNADEQDMPEVVSLIIETLVVRLSVRLVSYR